MPVVLVRKFSEKPGKNAIYIEDSVTKSGDFPSLLCHSFFALPYVNKQRCPSAREGTKGVSAPPEFKEIIMIDRQWMARGKMRYTFVSCK